MSDPTTQAGGVQWGIVLPALLLCLVGACGLVTGFGSPAFGSPWGVLVGLVALACFGIGLLSFFWMATRLQPRWYRASRPQG